MKKINKEKMYVFFIILLSVLLVGLFVLTTTGLFYKGEQKSDLSLQAGKGFVIDVEKTGCEVMSFEFDDKKEAWVLCVFLFHLHNVEISL